MTPAAARLPGVAREEGWGGGLFLNLVRLLPNPSSGRRRLATRPGRSAAPLRRAGLAPLRSDELLSVARQGGLTRQRNRPAAPRKSRRPSRADARRRGFRGRAVE